MAIPSTFHTAHGIALMRQDPGGEWFFVSWVTGSNATALEVLDAGTYRYELWWVIGADQSEVLTATYSGPARLAMLHLKV
jgi:hypothetical protein